MAGGTNSYQTTTEAWAQPIKTTKDAGGKFIHIQPMRWGETETSPGVFNFSDFDALYAQLETSGIGYTIDIGTPMGINKVDLPSDLIFTSFSNPTMVERYRKYVAAVLQKFPKPSHIILHTETASRFLENDKASWEAYCQLLANTADYIRTLAPKAKVGIYATSYDTSDEIALMSKNMDYFSFGYNADTGDLNHKEQIEKIFALAGERQVGIHEIGTPTSSIVKGSQEKQVEFVNLIFDLATAWGKQLEFMAYYQGFDEDPTMTSVWLPATFPDWTDQMKTEGIAWFGSLGLIVPSSSIVCPKVSVKAATVPTRLGTRSSILPSSPLRTRHPESRMQARAKDNIFTRQDIVHPIKA